MLTHSMEAQYEAIGEVGSKGNLHNAIKQAKKDPCDFKRSLDDVGEAGIPQELHNMILWMPKGVYTVKPEARMNAQHRSASFAFQQIVLTDISDRQAKHCIRPSQ